MQGFGVLLFVFSAAAIGAGFLGITGGMSDGDLKLTLLGTSLFVSGAIFVTVGLLAEGLRHAGELTSRQVPGGAPAAGGAGLEIQPQPGPSEAAGSMRRPGFHHAGAQRETA